MKRKTKRELEQAVVRAAVRWFKLWDMVPAYSDHSALWRRVRAYLRATKKPRSKR